MTTYNLSGSKLLRDGELIANRDETTGVVDFLPDMARYRAPATQYLKTLGLDKAPVAPPEVVERQRKPKPAGGPVSEAQETETVAPFAKAPESVTVQAKPVAPVKPREKTEVEILREEIAAMRQMIVGQNQPTALVENFVTPGIGNAPMDPNKLKTYKDAPPYGPDGDKTPEFVDWLYDNYPDDAAKRYFGRKTHRN